MKSPTKVRAELRVVSEGKQNFKSLYIGIVLPLEYFWTRQQLGLSTLFAVKSFLGADGVVYIVLLIKVVLKRVGLHRQLLFSEGTPLFELAKANFCDCRIGSKLLERSDGTRFSSSGLRKSHTKGCH